MFLPLLFTLLLMDAKPLCVHTNDKGLFLGMVVCDEPIFYPQTAEEMEAIEVEAVWGTELPPVVVVSMDEPPFLPAPRVDLFMSRVVSSDGPLLVHTASWQAPVIPPLLQPRLTVSFSPGLNIGRGVWSWRGTACNVTDIEQPADQGDVETAANSVSIPTIGYGEAQTSNQLYLNRSRPVVGSKIAQGISGLGTILIAARIITASSGWGAGAGVAMYVTGKLVDHFKSVTPASLDQRFAGTNILKDGSSVLLPSRSQQNHCATWEFFARYSGKNAVVRYNIPIY